MEAYNREKANAANTELKEKTGRKAVILKLDLSNCVGLADEKISCRAACQYFNYT